MSRRKPPNYGLKKKINYAFNNWIDALNKFEANEVDKAVKSALKKASKPIYADMEKEFEETHPGGGYTAKDLVQSQVKKEDFVYVKNIRYKNSQSSKGKGWVAFFFDYGAPQFKSAKAKASEDFISRAFGWGENVARREEVNKILTDELNKAFEKLQKKITDGAK